MIGSNIGVSPIICSWTHKLWYPSASALGANARMSWRLIGDLSKVCGIEMPHGIVM